MNTSQWNLGRTTTELVSDLVNTLHRRYSDVACYTSQWNYGRTFWDGPFLAGLVINLGLLVYLRRTSVAGQASSIEHNRSKYFEVLVTQLVCYHVWTRTRREVGQHNVIIGVPSDALVLRESDHLNCSPTVRDRSAYKHDVGVTCYLVWWSLLSHYWLFTSSPGTRIWRPPKPGNAETLVLKNRSGFANPKCRGGRAGQGSISPLCGVEGELI